MTGYLKATQNIFKILSKYNVANVNNNFVISENSIVYSHPLGTILKFTEDWILLNNYNLNQKIKRRQAKTGFFRPYAYNENVLLALILCWRKI